MLFLVIRYACVYEKHHILFFQFLVEYHYSLENVLSSSSVGKSATYTLKIQPTVIPFCLMLKSRHSPFSFGLGHSF